MSSASPDTATPRLRGSHWAAGYAGFVVGLVVTFVAYTSSGFGLDRMGLGMFGTVVMPLLIPLLVAVVARGGYKLASLGMVLAFPTLWIAFFVFILVGGLLN